VLKCR